MKPIMDIFNLVLVDVLPAKIIYLSTSLKPVLVPFIKILFLKNTCIGNSFAEAFQLPGRSKFSVDKTSFFRNDV